MHKALDFDIEIEVNDDDLLDEAVRLETLARLIIKAEQGRGKHGQEDDEDRVLEPNVGRGVGET